MTGRRLAQHACCAAVIATCLLVPTSAVGHGGPVIRGFGAAVIDANPAPGEWDSAGRYELNVNRGAAEGGGTVPATLYVMNDLTNLYAALRVTDASVGYSTFQLEFDNDHDDSRFGEVGDDALSLTNAGFGDRFYRQNPSGGFNWVRDDAYGGSQDGDGLDSDHPGFSFYEVSHRLDSSDDLHDFSLRPGMRVGFELYFLHCPVYAQCASSRVQSGDVVVVSGSRVPPDTQLSLGPKEGAMVANSSPIFEFAGTDDVLQPSQLTFECKVDDAAWQACTSSYQFDVLDGRHAFSVRALDEMLNVDQTPAGRNWTVDTTGPSKPVIRGRRSARQGQAVVLRFSASDKFTRSSAIRFKCAVDSTRLRRCPAVFRARLRPGRHVVRVKAVDRLGNKGDVATFRIRVKPTSR